MTGSVFEGEGARAMQLDNECRVGWKIGETGLRGEMESRRRGRARRRESVSNLIRS